MAKEREAWRQEQEQRISLIEERERQRDRRLSLADEVGATARGVRNFDPGAPSRFRKLRALARFLILSSYLLLGIVLAGIGITLWLWREGVIAERGILAIAIAAWLLAGGFLYSLFKFLGELSWLLADLGDHQHDVRNLLIDLRDDLHRRWSGQKG